LNYEISLSIAGVDIQSKFDNLTISFTFISMKKYLLILSSAVFYIHVSAQCASNRYLQPVFSNVTVTSGIQFGSATAYAALFPQNLYLDIYAPTGDTLTSRPLIVYAFGGGFLIGTRVDPPIPTYATYFARCGYVVASIDYRIGFNTVDTQSAERAVYRGVQDLRGAVRFLCQNYSQYKIDTTAIFLTGSSAGCFSGLHSCFMEQTDWPPCIHGTLLEPGDLGCMDCADNTNNNSRMPEIKGIISHWGAIFDTTYIRPTVKDNVPTICLQGDQDPIVPYNVGPPFSLPIFPDVYGSLPITIRMTDIGIKNELHTFVGYGHEPWLTAPQLVDTCYVYEIPFLYSIMQPQPLSVTGDATVCLNDIGSYSVRNDASSRYCWNVSGGTVLTNTNNAITVRWTTLGPHILTVQEMDRDEFSGKLDSLAISVVNHPVAAFGDSIHNGHVIFRDSSTSAVSWTYDFGDGSGAQAQNPTHIYGQAGSYTVSLIVSSGGCADTTYRTIIITKGSAGINEITDETVNVYPNPTDDILHIYPLPAGADVSIYDLAGKKMIEENTSTNEDMAINIRSLTSGIYILKINSVNLSINRKIIKR
jgi:hypothetical protein